MTRIVIEDVDDYIDLLNALSTVAQVFAKDDLYATEQQVFSKTRPLAGQPSMSEADPTADRPTPTPLIPCPNRGTHERLTDCGVCWADVMRGVAVETDVLVDGWNEALGRLSDETGQPL